MLTVRTGIRIGFAFFITVMLLLNIQGVLHPFTDAKLYGVEMQTLATPSAATILNSSWQQTAEPWIASTTGFRGLFLKADNQLTLSLFGELPMNESLGPIAGKEGYLYTKQYVDAYLGKNRISSQELEQRVQDLARLRDLLRHNGRAFIFLITPSKVRTYPEYLPESYIPPTLNHEQDNYVRLLPLLRKYDIPFLDGQAYMLSMKQRQEAPVFPKSGIHWTYYAAYLFGNDMIDTIGQLSGRPLKKLTLVSVEDSTIPKSSDNDLALNTNVFDTKRFMNKTYQYPTFMTTRKVTDWQPRILAVGGSFTDTPITFLAGYEVINDLTLLYYCNRIQHYTNMKIKDLERKPRSLSPTEAKNLILYHDIVLFENNTSTLNNIGHGCFDVFFNALNER